MTILKPEGFAAYLRIIADAVERGDSLEGSMEYTTTQEGVEVHAAIRTGNLNGQGGVDLL